MADAECKLDGKTYTLPVIIGTENEKAIDISNLRSASGYITIDEGYGNTGACKSAITFIDGEQGILRYRGYPIEQICEHSNFLETSYLLIYGELPTPEQYNKFKNCITSHTLLHEDLKRMYDTFPRDAHPMALLSAAISSLSTFYQDSLDPSNNDHIEISIIRMVAKIPTMAAYAYKKSIGQPLIYPDNSKSYAANFLNMMFSVPCEAYTVDPDVEKALDLLFVLHADHEQNCSASTVRLVGSSHANLFASISAGVCALWGPRHGGANEEVLRMLNLLQKEGGDIRKVIERVKNKDFKLMGFGHRVYKNYDPRAAIIKKACDRVLKKLGINDPILEIAKALEEAALADSYFIERKLYPNVDFYSGILYRAMGLPTNMFTVMFAIGRLPGRIAHWKEMNEGQARIGRPRQVYTGSPKRNYPAKKA
ncbi:MAG: citrate synthase [Planctomycetota bacterium]